MPRTLLGRAQLLVAAISAVIVAAILDAYAHANRFNLVQDAIGQQIDGAALAIPQDTTDRADTYVSAALVGTSVALVVAAILWIAWQVRVATIADVRGAGWRGEPRTGALVWLAPLVNLVAPPLVIATLMRALARPSTALVAGWWSCWIASAVLAPFGTRDPEALADQRLPDALAIGSDMLLVTAGVLAIGVVRRLTDSALDREEAMVVQAAAATGAIEDDDERPADLGPA